MADKQNIHMFTPWQFLVGIFTVACAVAPATWYISRTRLADELAQYRQSEHWELPKNLAALGQLSKQLKLTLDERAELERLREESRRYTTELEKLREEIDNSRKTITGLATRSAKLDETLEQNEQLSAKASTLERDFQTAKGNVESLSKRIKELEGDRFTIAKGEAHYIAPGVLAGYKPIR